MKLAATIATALLLLVDAFQLALAFGAPWGHLAWGGRHAGTLPARLRIASGIAGVVIYPLIVAFVLGSAGRIRAFWPSRARRGGMWLLAALFSVGTLANLASPSAGERYWGPVSLAIVVCCGVIARGAGDRT